MSTYRCWKFQLRIKSKDKRYRGRHISQHNRFERDGVLLILKCLDEFAPGGELMRIRTADISRRPRQNPDEGLYSAFCEKISEEMGRGTQDSIRKNFFPDLHRMGLWNIRHWRVYAHARASPATGAGRGYMIIYWLGRHINI